MDGTALFSEQHDHPVLGTHPSDSKGQCVSMEKWSWPEDDHRANQLLVVLRVMMLSYSENQAFNLQIENWSKGADQWFEKVGMQICAHTGNMQILFAQKQDAVKVCVMGMCVCACVCLCAFLWLACCFVC